jgi:hypothetical protein
MKLPSVQLEFSTLYVNHLSLARLKSPEQWEVHVFLQNLSWYWQQILVPVAVSTGGEEVVNVHQSKFGVT